MGYRAWALGAVVYYAGGNVLEITPLVLTESEADRAAQILGDATTDAAAGKVDEADVGRYAGW